MVALAVEQEKALQEDRLGISALSRYAFAGKDIGEITAKLLIASTKQNNGLGALMDLSVVEQIRGNPEAGIDLQRKALSQHNLFRTISSRGRRLKLLVLAAPIHMGGNTPVEMLLESADVEINTVYIAPGLPIPNPLPEFDLIFVAAPGDTGSVNAIMPGMQPNDFLNEISKFVSTASVPIVNQPEPIFHLERDTLPSALEGLKGVKVPTTIRCDLDQIAVSLIEGDEIRSGELSVQFPLAIRPVGSHAGFGFEMIRTPKGLNQYLNQYQYPEYFVSELIDYSSEDGEFRKFRIMFVDGKAFPVHMAISNNWKLWYMNAGMDLSERKRAEEDEFLTEFQTGFGRRFRRRLSAMAERIQLDYFGIDCAVDKRGDLVIFEADNAMIVHNMDPEEIYPYKAPAMQKLFLAFEQMLFSKAKLPSALGKPVEGGRWTRVK